MGFEVRRSIQLSYGRAVEYGVGDGVRTRGHRDHNPVLYQLSYAHHGNSRIVVCHGAEEQAKQRITDRPDPLALELGTWNLKAALRAAST